MNKRIVLCLLIPLAVFGCQIKEENEFAPKSKNFTATMEAFVDDASGIDTKTSLDAGGSVLWKMGDQVSIFAGSTINEHYQVTDASDGRTAAALNRVESPGFVAGGDIDNNVAFYPYAETAELAKNGSAYVIRDIALPATQIYAQASFGNGAFPMTAVTSSARDYNLKFKNVLGGLKLQLKGTATIASISVTGNNNEKLCGAAEVTVSTASAPSITLKDASAKTVTLNCGDGVQLDASTATVFIIALPPMTMSGGFTVIVKDSEGASMEIKTTKSQTITRSNLLLMPAVDYEGVVPVQAEAVDLGLPSGVKWASFNIGASAPEEYGDYFAWGETKPYYTVGHSQDNPCSNWEDNKTGYNWASYKFELGTDYNGPFSKYVTNSSYGTVDNNTVLDPEDDAAIVNWGGSWRMPTDADWYELIDECTWTWTIQNGINGYLVTGTNNNSIFLPAAGNRDGTGLYYTASSGRYWSSSLNAEGGWFCAWYLIFYSGGVLRDGYNQEFFRCLGRSVRAVHDERVRISVTGVSLNKNSLSLSEGETLSLTAIVMPSNATQPTVKWWSSNYSVAAVDDTGKVTARNAGSATITVGTCDGGYTATCAVTVSAIPEAVDLGLPSGLKWASFNLGANAPEDYGDYFAWGDTEPNYTSQDPLTWRGNKTGYDWVSYKFRTSGDSYDNVQFSKYNTSSSYGPVDNNTVLDPEDDAAAANWGGSWRMPTDAEWTELRTECAWTWTTQNRKEGYLVTSNTNGNSIFLPAAGRRYDTDLYNTASSGLYWASSLITDGRPDCAWCVSFGSNYVDRSGAYRFIGFSVRPVSDEGRIPVTSVTLNKTSLSLVNGTSETLTATVNPSNATDKTVTWSSNATSVATVDANGKVTAVGVGTATITAFAGGRSASCVVSVVIPVTSIRIFSAKQNAEVTSLTMFRGDTDDLSIVCYPTNATNKSEYTSYSNQYWNSDYKYITVVSGSVRIDENCATGITKPVTVSVKGLTASCSITVLSDEP